MQHEPLHKGPLYQLQVKGKPTTAITALPQTIFRKHRHKELCGYIPHQCIHIPANFPV